MRKPIQHVRDAGGHETDARVSGAVVQAKLTVPDDCATWENDVGDVAGDLVRRLRADDPFISTSEDAARIIEVEQGQADAIKRTSRSVAYAVIDDEPPLGASQ